MANKEIILDVSVIIDLWIGENAFEMTEQLIDTAVSQKHGMWIAASSLATLDYVGRQALKRKGKPTAKIPGMVAGLIENLLSFVSVLSCHGFEQLEIHACAHDFEDAQIAACARSLTGADVCIVTEDRKFDTLGEISALTPSEALAWLEDDAFDAESAIPFIDLKTQQRAIRPTLEKNIEQVLRHGRYIMGPEIEELGYQELLTKHCPNLIPPFVEDHNTSVFAQYTVQTENRDELTERINQAGVPIAVHYPVSLHLQSAFKDYGYNEGDLPVAESVSKRVFSLPMGPDLSEEVQDRVIKTLSSTLSLT